MPTVHITSRIIGTTVMKPVEMLKSAGITIAENPHLAAGKNLKEDQLIPLINRIDGILVGDTPLPWSLHKTDLRPIWSIRKRKF